MAEEKTIFHQPHLFTVKTKLRDGTWKLELHLVDLVPEKAEVGDSVREVVIKIDEILSKEEPQVEGVDFT